MTIKKEKNNSTEKTQVADETIADDKASKVAKKLETMGVMPSEDKTTETIPEVERRKFSPFLLATLVIVPLAGIVVYMYLTVPFKSILPVTDSSTATYEQITPEGYASPSARQSQFPVQQMANNRYQASEPDWVVQQRTEMQKRRDEFDKRNKENYPVNWPSTVSAEPPQWVQDRQAEIQQQISKFQQEMEKQQEQFAKQQQQWTNQAASWQYNKAPTQADFMKHPRMNAYAQNYNDVNKQVQARSNQNPVNAYQHNNRQFQNVYNYPWQQQYYNAPAYGYGPYNVPYGWPGQVYR